MLHHRFACLCPCTMLLATAAILALHISACSADPGKHASASQGSSSSSRPLIIATDRGIEEIDQTGKVLRRISPTPARRPRFAPDGTLIFMAAGFAELKQVGLDGKGERSVASIPPGVAAECNVSFPGSWDPGRLLFSDEDMVVDAGGKAVCMHLTDGGDTGVWLRVESSSGKPGRGELAVVCGGDPPGEDFQCKPRARSASSASPSGPFRVQNRSIVTEHDGARKQVKKLDVHKLNEEVHSSSGRWSLVSAWVKQGKYAIQRILVLDHQSGDMYAIAPGSWPGPMTDKNWRALEKGEDVTAEAAERSDIRALSHHDLFILDTLLISPGERIVDTRAQFAY